jgi:hypothetical protein
MFDGITPTNQPTGAGLVSESGQPLVSKAALLHALDDPEVWRSEPAYAPPADIDIKAEQKWIDDMMGTTRNGESIYKLVWNGDQRFWYEFYMQWNVLGKPTAPLVQRPRVRYKILRDPKTGQILRDVFPPRWLILTRLEPEQYADTWKQESFVWAPEINTYKQIRPDEPPKVFWLWYATIATHNGFCCTEKRANQELCYGMYAPPRALYDVLGGQKRADDAAGVRNVFQKIDSSFIGEIEDENTGYKLEIAELEVEKAIFMENPMALLGVHAAMKASIDDHKTAERIVKDYYDRQIQERSKLI